MSGVGSTNAMKKGSANNPFLAYSEADMQGFLNSAYTGCIVKYAGEPISRYLTEHNKTVPERVKNLVFSLTDDGFWEFFDRGNIRIKIQQKTNGSTKTLYITPGRFYNGAWHFDKLSFTNSNLYLTDSLTAPTETLIAIQKYFDTEPYWRWDKECVNDQGNLTIWTYDQDVTFTIEQATTEYGIAYDSTHGITIVPYKVNELYKVVYGNGKYYYEEFYHISDTRTTANSDYIAPGKTTFDFTGNLQTGTGSKINPYLAYTVAEFQSFPVGSFIKWLGPNKTVIDTTTGQMLIHGEVYRAVEDGDILQYVILPTLSNPGTAADLAQGKQLIDGEGKVVEGEAESAEGKLAMNLFAKTITDINDLQGSIKSWPAVYYSANNYYRAAFCTNCQQLSRVNLPNISSNSGAAIPSMAFYGCTNLKYVNVGYFSEIYSSAFIGCKNLREIKGLDNVTYLASSAFVNAKFVRDDEFVLPKFSKLTNINAYHVFNGAELFDVTDETFPAVTYISGYSTFYNTKNITKLSLTNLETVSGYYTFKLCKDLQEINCPKLLRIFGQDCFSGCNKLSSINIPAVSYIGSGAFQGCKALTYISLPAVTTLSSGAFGYCTFSKIVLPSLSKMNNDPFYGCKSLVSVYLPNSIVCSATNNIFNSTPMRSLYSEAGYKYGSIYVPMSLLSQYQSAPYWSNLSSRIVGLTDEEFASVLT